MRERSEEEQATAPDEEQATAPDEEQSPPPSGSDEEKDHVQEQSEDSFPASDPPSY